MNKFDERYEIRLAFYQDIEAIMSFIDTYWRKGHILARDRELFEYEFVEGENVHVVLAIERETNSIQGIFGFSYCSHCESKRDIWGSLWKINDQHDNIPFLGVELAKRVYALTGCRMCLGNGVNPKTALPLRKRVLKDKTGKMGHYYCLNPSIKEHCVCKILEPRYLPFKKQNRLLGVTEFTSMEELTKVFDIGREDAYPYKDAWYIEKRYFNHPYYKYHVFGLREETGVKAIVICRVVDAEGVQVLRIMDYIGEHEIFAETGGFWRKEMSEFQYEYVDFYEFGMESKILDEAGFVCRKDGDINVIPNYFEPFLQENVDIWVSYQYDGTTFFKGDADQDRPNTYVPRK